MLEMSVVLCYGDCTLETGPVISGYRLCLVYNLNHAESGLERVLTRWRSTGSPNLFAYILEHQYSPERFSHGLNILEGQDVHKMAALNMYAEQLGFMLCLGNLVCRAPRDLASYDSNEDIESHGQKCEVRWTSYGLSTEQDCGGSSINSTFDDGDEPEIDQRFFYILNLVDQEGKTLRNSKERLKLKAPQIVPLSAFEDVDPDETVYKSFQVEGCVSLNWDSNKSCIDIYILFNRIWAHSRNVSAMFWFFEVYHSPIVRYRLEAISVSYSAQRRGPNRAETGIRGVRRHQRGYSSCRLGPA